MPEDIEGVVAPPEEEAKPAGGQPNPEELQKQLAALQTNSKTFEDNWKNEQRVSSKKEQELQRYREQQARNDSQEDMLKALIAVVAQQQNQPVDEFEEGVKQKQPDLLKTYEQIAEKNRKQRELDRVTSQLKSIQNETVSLGLKEGEDDYEFIRAMAESGKFDKAEARLNKLREATQVAPKEVPPETDIEKLVAERLKAELEQRGLLTQDAGAPSASASTEKDIWAKVASGEMSTEEARKRGVSFS